MTVHDLRGWMDPGELEAVSTDEGIVLPWPELVSFGMGVWSQETVEEALGADAVDAFPSSCGWPILKCASREWTSWRWNEWRLWMAKQ